jgi:hypothetical protein
MSERLSASSGKAAEKPTDIANKNGSFINEGIIVGGRSTFINNGALSVGGRNGHDFRPDTRRVDSSAEEPRYEQDEDSLIGDTEDHEVFKSEEVPEETSPETLPTPEDQETDSEEEKVKKSKAIEALFGDSFGGKDPVKVFDKLGLNIGAVDEVLAALESYEATLKDADEEARRLEDDQSPKAEARKREIQADVEPALEALRGLEKMAEQLRDKYEKEADTEVEPDTEEVATADVSEGDHKTDVEEAVEAAKGLATSAHEDDSASTRPPATSEDSAAVQKDRAPKESGKRPGWLARRRLARQTRLNSKSNTRQE